MLHILRSQLLLTLAPYDTLQNMCTSMLSFEHATSNTWQQRATCLLAARAFGPSTGGPSEFDKSCAPCVVLHTDREAFNNASLFLWETFPSGATINRMDIQVNVELLRLAFDPRRLQ